MTYELFTSFFYNSHYFRFCWKKMRYFLFLEYILLYCNFVLAHKNITEFVSSKDLRLLEVDDIPIAKTKTTNNSRRLSSEESLRNLSAIADRIDKNNDRQIGDEELRSWIQFAQTRYVHNECKSKFNFYDRNSDSTVEWKDEYKNAVFSILDEAGVTEDSDSGYRTMLTQDRRRWDQADVDGDDNCTEDEFCRFLHPEAYDNVKEVILKEVFDDLDKNKDGVVDLPEYIGDVFDEQDKAIPNWYFSERQIFFSTRDKDGDGNMNEKEVHAWIMPDEIDIADAEAKHLFEEADDNRNGFLSKEEILAHHDKFIRSQATDWGEALLLL